VYVTQDPAAQLLWVGPLVSMTVQAAAVHEVGGPAAMTAGTATNATPARTAQKRNAFLNRIASASPFDIVIVSVAEGATTLKI
jgi:hypothetical protein